MDYKIDWLWAYLEKENRGEAAGLDGIRNPAEEALGGVPVPIGDLWSADLTADLRDETEDLFMNLLQAEAIARFERRRFLLRRGFIGF